MAQITITLVKSPIGHIPVQRKTVKALGLGKIGSQVIKEDTPAIRGMAASIAHLVKVGEANGASAQSKAKKAVSEKKAEAPKAAEKVKKQAAAEVKGDKPTAASKVADIKAYLDAQGVKYASTDKKADLLAKLD